jgi:hypothetical protein
MIGRETREGLSPPPDVMRPDYLTENISIPLDSAERGHYNSQDETRVSGFCIVLNLHARCWAVCEDGLAVHSKWSKCGAPIT